MFTIKIHFYFQEIASNSALKKHTFRLLQMAIQESKSKSISRFGSFLFVLSQNQNFLSAFVELSYALSRLRVDCFRILRTAPTVQKVRRWHFCVRFWCNFSKVPERWKYCATWSLAFALETEFNPVFGGHRNVCICFVGRPINSWCFSDFCFSSFNFWYLVAVRCERCRGQFGTKGRRCDAFNGCCREG